MEKSLILVGTQWGDEGKGKIVDFFSKKFKAVCRFQGGHNAGPMGGELLLASLGGCFMSFTS